MSLLLVISIFRFIVHRCNSKECTGEDSFIADQLGESIRVCGCSAKSVAVFLTGSHLFLILISVWAERNQTCLK
jgi:hypothetical protein